MKFNIICADCPWPFSDPLSMTDTKRGAEANYNTMTMDDIKNLPIQNISADDSVLILWCPSSLLPQGLDIMKYWGFDFKQTNIWVKIKNNPLKFLTKNIFINLFQADSYKLSSIKKIISDSVFDFNNILSFGMGRLFRQTHEIALIGVKGKVYKFIVNKSQRSVHLFKALKHSKKPELMQDMLEKMFPNFENKLELFARRDRDGWVCLGNEASLSYKEDINISLKKLSVINDDFVFNYDNWKDIVI